MGRHLASQPDQSRPARPYPVHAGVDLEVDGDRTRRGPVRPRAGPGGSGGVQQGDQAVLGVNGGRQVVLDHQGHGLGGRFGEHQDGDVDTRLAQLVALLGQSDPKIGRPTLQGRPGHGHRPVPVAVRLDDGADGRGRHRGAKMGDIGPYGRQVDLDPCRPEPSGDTLGRHQLGGRCALTAAGPARANRPPGRAGRWRQGPRRTRSAPPGRAREQRGRPPRRRAGRGPGKPR